MVVTSMAWALLMISHGRQLIELTNRGAPRRRHPTTDNEQLRQILDPHLQAFVQGGDARQKPASSSRRSCVPQT